MNIFKTTIARVRALPLRYSLGGGIMLGILVLWGIHVATRPAATAAITPQVAHVRVSSVASLSSQTGPLPVTGKVTSLSQATILAQSSGEIVRLYRALGDHVSAGSVIASFENSSQQASVQQAEGAYEAAQAALAKASGSTAVNSGLSSVQAAQNSASTKTAAEAALQSTYAALDDAVHTKADALFSNPRAQVPTFVLTIPDSQLGVNVVNERVHLEEVLQNASALTAGHDVDSAAISMIMYAQEVSTFLNDVIKALNQALPNQNTSAMVIAANQASISLGRINVSGAIASLTAAKGAYDSAQTSAQTTANTAISGTNNDIAAAQANVKQALGALNNARASLNKTIVLSPISGTIVSLPVTQGDFVPSFAPVAEVSNPGALEIDTYVTADDAKTLTVGSKAIIDGNVSGTIVSIAPAVDPSTGKIPVKVGILGDQSHLTDGDTVTVSVSRSSDTNSTKANAKMSAILIPIVAAKITPLGPVVFMVSSSTLVAQPVTLGTILGDQVTVLSGLTPQMIIVTDARGLSNKQPVVVDTN